MAERWRAIGGYRGHYEVSDLGRVRALQFINGKGSRVLSEPRVLRIHQGGSKKYLYTSLRKNGQQRTHRIHRLVLEAFGGPPPSGMEWV